MAKVFQGVKEHEFLPEFSEQIKKMEDLINGTSDGDTIAMAEALINVCKELSKLKQQSGLTDAFVEND